MALLKALQLTLCDLTYITDWLPLAEAFHSQYWLRIRKRDENGDIWRQVAKLMTQPRAVVVLWQASHLSYDDAMHDPYSTWYTWQANKHADELAGQAAADAALPEQTRADFMQHVPKSNWCFVE